MTQIRRARRSPAIAIAVLALIAALAGTAIAGSGPEANTSASAKKTAKKALKKAKKAKKQAKGNAALLAELCGTGASAAGSATCTAPQGPKGDKGDTGNPGASGYQTVASASAFVGLANGLTATVSVPCPAGKKVLGGGGDASGSSDTHTPIIRSEPKAGTGNTEWEIEASNEGAMQTVSVGVQAICATVD